MIRCVIVFVLVFFNLAACQERDVPTLDGRIVGGTDADIKNYPYQISFQVMSSHYCGGAIIAPDWIITAAHCVESVILPSFVTIRAGSSTRGAGGQVYTVLKIISHPEYSRQTIDYDIAILQLSSKIPSDIGKVIALPSSGSGPTPGTLVTVTGWGALTQGGSAPSVLQVVQVPVVSQAACRDAYTVSQVTDRMFCAGYLGVGGKDSCQGDSGGPVVANGILVGLVSWGEGCALPDYPGVYTNVPNLRDWIYANSGF